MHTAPAASPAPDLCTHFGLHHLPFTREIAVSDRFRLAPFDELLDDLHRLISHRLGAAIIAPAGTGKTVLLRCLRDALPEARYRTHYLKVTDLGKRDFCREMATALGAKTAGTYGALVRHIQDRCNALCATESLHPVLLIDECHDARPEVLSILRLVANFEMDSRLGLSMVLCGQSPLRAMLRRDALEAVSRRLTRVATLRLLSRDETRDYLAHRLRLAGAQAELYNPHAIEALFEATQGNLRALDCLALRTLQLCASAGHQLADARLVSEARAQVWP